MHLPLQSVFRDLGNRSKRLRELEARVGIEPTHKGFADLSLTTWVPRLGWASKDSHSPEESFSPAFLQRKCNAEGRCLERETGVEPATSSLARKHSTTELLPLSQDQVYRLSRSRS